MADTKTILIVDDSTVSRMMIKTKIISMKPDWEILEAKDGDQALSVTKEHADIDYFSVDLNMPGMDGLELIEKLQDSYSSSQIALLTANIQEEIFKRSMKLGAACFNKPITEKVIEDLLVYFDGK